MRLLTVTKKGHLILLIGLLIANYGAAIYVRSNYREVANLQQQLRSETEKVARFKESDLIEQDDFVVPSQIKLSEFITQLEQVVAKYEISLINFTSDSKSETEEVIKLPLEVSFVGDYKNLINLILDLEQQERLVTIEELKLKGTEEDKLRMNLLLNMYALQ
ncbi:type 4a pilus biogenesis protein PilO [Natroniella acetigena]|uniref:type 4a pilus biogenesis protein PilO n=1 Tax=Natroniella acetigena TaxID=52004 RepID=UPI00200A6DC8|nr:type 4a pilus biogenesis protein PilO [Natroniella acetigena]MCK8826648.1 type 4a pilus biogenesis protein PilO [Natroniella acetigena]